MSNRAMTPAALDKSIRPRELAVGALRRYSASPERPAGGQRAASAGVAILGSGPTPPFTRRERGQAAVERGAGPAPFPRRRCGTGAGPSIASASTRWSRPSWPVTCRTRSRHVHDPVSVLDPSNISLEALGWACSARHRWAVTTQSKRACRVFTSEAVREAVVAVDDLAWNRSRGQRAAESGTG